MQIYLNLIWEQARTKLSGKLHQQNCLLSQHLPPHLPGLCTEDRPAQQARVGQHPQPWCCKICLKHILASSRKGPKKTSQNAWNSLLFGQPHSSSLFFFRSQQASSSKEVLFCLRQFLSIVSLPKFDLNLKRHFSGSLQVKNQIQMETHCCWKHHVTLDRSPLRNLFLDSHICYMSPWYNDGENRA